MSKSMEAFNFLADLVKHYREEYGNVALVLRGLPGSGKSSLTSMLREVFGYANVEVFSADAEPDLYDDEGRIRRELLPRAHGSCLRYFAQWCDGALGLASVGIVDNTNVNLWECAKYVELGTAMGLKTVLVNIHCDPSVALARNVHNVPEEVHARMARDLKNEKLLPWWEVVEVEMD